MMQGLVAQGQALPAPSPPQLLGDGDLEKQQCKPYGSNSELFGLYTGHADWCFLTIFCQKKKKSHEK